mmetsp:Transcript_138311/g.240451  ORF Transcript_138311/g.240451 Transcript_138311/m.240451 type:complete len:95 (+) Transcript_138311:1046-1330(+)
MAPVFAKVSLCGRYGLGGEVVAVDTRVYPMNQNMCWGETSGVGLSLRKKMLVNAALASQPLDLAPYCFSRFGVAGGNAVISGTSGPVLAEGGKK